jgi:hypothetical protein
VTLYKPVWPERPCPCLPENCETPPLHYSHPYPGGPRLRRRARISNAVLLSVPPAVLIWWIWFVVVGQYQ